MPKGPYSGLGYQLSTIASQVPSGYLRGIQAREQMDAGESALRQKQASDQADAGESEGVRQAFIEATDPSGRVDTEKLYGAMGQYAPNKAAAMGPAYMSSQTQKKIGEMTGMKTLQAAAFTWARQLKSLPIEQRQNFFEEHIAPAMEMNGMPPQQIEAWKSKMDDTSLSAIANSDPTIAKIQETAKTKIDLAVVTARFKQDAIRLSGAYRLKAAVQRAATKPPNNVEARIYQSVLDGGGTSEDAAKAIMDFRIGVAQGKAKNVPVRKLVGDMVTKMNAANVAFRGSQMSPQELEELENLGYRLYGEAESEDGAEAKPSLETPKTTPPQGDTSKLKGQKTSKPDGTYPLIGGGTVTVKNGVIQ